jgi:hypothetical protein
MSRRPCNTATRRPIRRSAGGPASYALIARRAGALAVAGLLVATGSALAAVRLTTGATYVGKSTACHRPTAPGTSCTFSFHASRNGFGLRFVGPTVVSSWACRKGGGEALLGGKVAGNDPVPSLILRSDGTLYGSAGSGPNRVRVTGHIAEAGTKVVITFHLAHGHCVTPKVTLIEGPVAPGGH